MYSSVTVRVNLTTPDKIEWVLGEVRLEGKEVSGRLLWGTWHWGCTSAQCRGGESVSETKSRGKAKKPAR